MVTPVGPFEENIDISHLSLISALTSNLTWSGITAIMTAGENLVIGDAVYVKNDSKVWKADADAAATMPVIALATGTILADASGVFLLHGFVRQDAWTWLVGGLLYADEGTGGTPGTMTSVAPAGAGDQVQVVGIGFTADIAYFSPSLELVEVT